MRWLRMTTVLCFAAVCGFAHDIVYGNSPHCRGSAAFALLRFMDAAPVRVWRVNTCLLPLINARIRRLGLALMRVFFVAVLIVCGLL